MKVIDLPVTKLKGAPWNSNQMDPQMIARLGESIKRYGLVQNPVVRLIDNDLYEVIDGNWRWKVLSEMEIDTIPCAVVDVDDANARILAQALNRIEGEDDLGLRAEMFREILHTIPEQDVLAILPETADSLQALASLGQETIAAYIENWQQAQSARLKHLQFQLTSSQLEVIEEALVQWQTQAKNFSDDSPNSRGTALYLLCKHFLESRKEAQ
ncbi:MAG: ParB N-terminal domain-containing protein [Chloroflexi bacterium]|nr:ParB N-terminal domain-containing protein [Chloroflexota bacterium]